MTPPTLISRPVALLPSVVSVKLLNRPSGAWVKVALVDAVGRLTHLLVVASKISVSPLPGVVMRTSSRSFREIELEPPLRVSIRTQPFKAPRHSTQSPLS